MNDRVFIVAPGGFVTGGPEALHQLADALNRDQPGRATIIYRPFKSDWQIPKPFRRYQFDVADARVETSGATVVLPETSADMIRVFASAARIDFWWLSVDRFFKITGSDSATYLEIARRYVTRHLYQSEHARQFLESEGLGPTAHLGDYLADEYRRAALRPPGTRRDTLLCYNPAKGTERTEQILKALDGSVEIVPLVDMSRNEIQRVLKRAKVYIDFGEHPGKDRIPREAAALGACVITNRRGSAGNDVDVPISSWHKVDDTTLGFEWEVASKIAVVMIDFQEHQSQFMQWRKQISVEEREFRSDVVDCYGS